MHSKCVALLIPRVTEIQIASSILYILAIKAERGAQSRGLGLYNQMFLCIKRNSKSFLDPVRFCSPSVKNAMVYVRENERTESYMQVIGLSEDKTERNKLTV